jgi:hypothetical protein
MPSTLTGALSGLCLDQLRGVDIEVGEDLGDVVQLLGGEMCLKNSGSIGVQIFVGLRLGGFAGAVNGGVE